MVFVLASCGKSENTGSGTNADAAKTTEASKTPDTTKETETTKSPEVTKEADTTKAPEVTKEPETTKVPEVTEEPTTTPDPVETTPEPTENIEDPDEVHTVDGFGGNMYLQEDISGLDVYGKTFLGVYAENTENPELSYYFDYVDNKISFDNMDEFSCAFLYFSAEENEDSKLCFLEKGINSAIDWMIRTGTLKAETENGSYFGDFYYGTDSNGNGNLYICLHIDEYNVWLIGLAQ